MAGNMAQLKKMAGNIIPFKMVGDIGLMWTTNWIKEYKIM